MSRMGPILSQLALHAWDLFALSWGLVSLMITFAITIIDGSFFRRRPKSATRDLAVARDDLWNLSSTKYGTHRFHELEHGIKLHYVERRSPEAPSRNGVPPQNLVIFLHGFPDSWAMWKGFLELPDQAPSSWLVAVDLPGHGGSDGLESYGPDAFLEIMADFILAMRQRYLPDGHPKNKVLIVGHDWGAVVAFRIAAQAPQVADRFILGNSVLPELARTNITDRCSSAIKMARTWFNRLCTSPRHAWHDFRLVNSAFDTLFPLLRQLFLSHYVSIFHLPHPFPTIYGRLGSYWFLRKAHSHALSGKNNQSSGPESPPALASSLGPDITNCGTTTADRSSYGSCVRARAQRIDGDFPQKIRIYREGLLTRPWSMSSQSLASFQMLSDSLSCSLSERRESTSFSDDGHFDNGPVGALKAPCTILWGAKDAALDRMVCLEGMGAYLVGKRSQVILLPEGGHWAITEKDGIRIARECLLWSLQGESDSLEDRVQAMKRNVKFLVDK